MRRRKPPPGNEAPMIITPRMLARMIARIVHAVRARRRKR
jgi:hypothetical protein